MKTSNGTTLKGNWVTREELEEALKRTDAPGFEPGDLVTWKNEKGTLGVVLPSTDGPLALLMNQAWSKPLASETRVLALQGKERLVGHTYTASAGRLQLVRDIREVK